MMDTISEVISIIPPFKGIDLTSETFLISTLPETRTESKGICPGKMPIYPFKVGTTIEVAFPSYRVSPGDITNKLNSLTVIQLSLGLVNFVTIVFLPSLLLLQLIPPYKKPAQEDHHACLQVSP